MQPGLKGCTEVLKLLAQNLSIVRSYSIKVQLLHKKPCKAFVFNRLQSICPALYRIMALHQATAQLLEALLFRPIFAQNVFLCFLTRPDLPLQLGVFERLEDLRK